VTRDPPRGGLHHVELWVADLAGSAASLGWLLEQLGYRERDRWAGGRSWRLGATYFVLEQSPALTGTHRRLDAGLNHLAFWAGSRADVDALTAYATQRGWTLMFPDRHPHAGGPAHYAAYLEDEHGFEVELVAGSA